MSARYGRNQRRKHREELAARDREVTRLEAVASEHWEKTRQQLRHRAKLECEVIEWATRIVDLLGDDSAFAKDMPTRRIDAGLFSAVSDGQPYRTRATGRFVHPLNPSHVVAFDTAQHIIDTFAIRAGQDADIIQLRRRFILQGPRGQRALMMDERTLHNLQSRGNVELQRWLLDQLVKPWMAGR